MSKMSKKHQRQPIRAAKRGRKRKKNGPHQSQTNEGRTLPIPPKTLPKLPTPRPTLSVNVLRSPAVTLEMARGSFRAASARSTQAFKAYEMGSAGLKMLLFERRRRRADGVREEKRDASLSFNAKCCLVVSFCEKTDTKRSRSR